MASLLKSSVDYRSKASMMCGSDRSVAVESCFYKAERLAEESESWFCSAFQWLHSMLMEMKCENK